MRKGEKGVTTETDAPCLEASVSSPKRSRVYGRAEPFHDVSPNFRTCTYPPNSPCLTVGLAGGKKGHKTLNKTVSRPMGGYAQNSFASVAF